MSGTPFALSLSLSLSLHRIISFECNIPLIDCVMEWRLSTPYYLFVNKAKEMVTCDGSSWHTVALLAHCGG
jgi:hypothetical protein